MEFNYSSEFNFDSSSIPSNNIEQLVSQNLSTVSTSEIKSFCNRVNFYLEHFSIINKKHKTASSDNKVHFLKKLSEVLKNEVDKRTVQVSQ